MKRFLMMAFVALMIAASIEAQTSLAGRVYYNGNLMEKELSEVKKEAKGLEKEAKTAEEKEEVKGVQAILNAVVAKMTVKFIDDKTVELSIDSKFDEEKAKQGGASWLMRKMVKMKMGKGKSEKGQTTYTVNGRKVIINSVKKKGKTKTYELSEDGKTLTFTDKDRSMTLKRIK